MKWWYTLVVVLLVLPMAQAEVKDRVYDADNFFSTFNNDLFEASCPYVIDHTFAPSYWPVSGACSSKVDVRSDFGAASIDIDRVGQGEYSDANLAYMHSFIYRKDSGLFGDKHKDDFDIRLTSKDLLNQFDYAAQPVDGKNATQIFNMAWCGETLDATYTKEGGTLSPKSLFFSVDDQNGNECEAKTYPWAGYSSDKELKGFYTNRNFYGQFYELPLKRVCAGYAVKIVDRSATDWPAPGNPVTLTEQPANNYERTFSQGDNQFTITLKTNNDKQLESIRVRSTDRSNYNGGVSIVLFCVDPADPDTSQNACNAADGDWHPSPDQDYADKCCGDDKAFDIGDMHKDSVCEQQANGYKWESLASKCEYPVDWIIYGANGVKLDAVALNATAKAQGVYYPEGGCCSVPSNIGKRINSDTDESICVVQPDNRTRWFTASTASRFNASVINYQDDATLNTQLRQFNRSSPIIAASNSSIWQLCGLEANQMPVAQTCDLVSSRNDPSICFGKWIKYELAKGYYLDNASNPRFDRNGAPDQDKTKAAAACANGNPSSNKKYNPAKNDYGFCEANQCYYDASTCIQNGTWIYNDICTAAANSVDWETRTRFLAEALYSSAGNAPFILHCDSSPEAINSYQQIVDYETKAIVNSFCVLSKGNAVTVGVTLSPTDGNGNNPSLIPGAEVPELQPAIEAFDENLPPFIKLLDKTDEFGEQTEACSNAIDSEAYTLCTGIANGKVYYNNEYGTLVFSKDTFSPGATFMGSIVNWWNGIRFGETPIPTIPLGGQKMYFAKGSDGNTIQGRFSYTEPKGDAEAKIVGVKMPNLMDLCETKEESSDRYKCEENGDVTIVTITRPTQNEWELFTLRIRP